MNDIDTRPEIDPDEPYNPYKEYLRERIIDSADENEYNFKSRTLTEKVEVPKASRLVNIALVLSIVSLLGAFYLSPYYALVAAILALAASLITRFIGNEEGRFHPRAKAALIISLIAIAIIAFLFIFILYIYPELLKDPSYREMLQQFTEELEQKYPDAFPAATQPALPDDIL